MYWITNEENESKPRRLCIHFGSGLVGNAIVRQLLKHGKLLIHKRVEWSNIALTVRWIADCELAHGHYDCIDIVWAAGKAKFSDPREVTQKEQQDSIHSSSMSPSIIRCTLLLEEKYVLFP